MGLYKELRRSLRAHMAFEEPNTLLIMSEALFAGMVLQLTNPFYQLFAFVLRSICAAARLIIHRPSQGQKTFFMHGHHNMRRDTSPSRPVTFSG